MALQQIIDAIVARLPKDVATAIGEEQIAVEGKPPRVVFVPKTERFAPGRGLGGDGITMPGPIVTREAGIIIHIWGETLDATEELLGHIVAAMQAIAPTCFRLQSGSWPARRIEDFGFVYILESVFLIPLTREPDAYVTVTALPITPMLNIPSP